MADSAQTGSAMSVVVEGLSVRFGDFFAVNNVTFSVKPGEIFGFLGANGAGKTTTIRVLCGLLPPTAGRVRIAGHDLADGLEAVKRQVGYMSQKFTLYNDLTVAENLAFASELRKIPRTQFLKRRDELLAFIEFDRDLNGLVRDLPGGVKQQVSLAAAVLHEPQVVFLDEPTAGVTPVARARFWALIRQLSGQGKTVFVTTHYMDEAEQCGRIALMRSGEIIALDEVATLKAATFPNGVYELTARSQDGTGADKLEALASFASVQPYGLRYHAFVRDQSRWAAAQDSLTPHFEVRLVQPSLEDVFIQRVEGDTR
jgi:ABC-2 type transport system ATP-binding protein